MLPSSMAVCCHSYVFGLLGDQGDAANARNLCDNMMRYRTNFAKTGSQSDLFLRV